jgi:hypothetical protein
MASALQTRLTRQLASRGVKDAKGMAIGLLTKRGDLKGGELTDKGKSRQALGNDGRAKDRESRYSGGKNKPSDYKYNAKTNAATLKKG